MELKRVFFFFFFQFLCVALIQSKTPKGSSGNEKTERGFALLCFALQTFDDL
ncbi:hypothetical protein ACB098_06G174700 [Castanea mollissima]